ncbi:MAG: DMT family transporter [Desulfuromonadales bacterium]|nr:DMT family transporter [Desulfuromonadales bacterium]
MSSFGFMLLMFLGGISVAVQPSINARLAEKVGALESATISFAVGTLALLVVAFVAGRGSFRGLANVQGWELTGGFLGAFFVSLTIIAVPRIGTAAVMAALIAAQLATGVLLDHYGIFGFKAIPLDLKRSIGICLLLAGSILVFRR